MSLFPDVIAIVAGTSAPAEPCAQLQENGRTVAREAQLGAETQVDLEPREPEPLTTTEATEAAEAQAHDA